MTLDQVFLLLMDKKKLRHKGLARVSNSNPLTITGMSDKEGFIKGRDEKGNLIKGRIAGKSLASQIREKAEQRKREELLSKKKRK